VATVDEWVALFDDQFTLETPQNQLVAAGVVDADFL